MNNDQQIVEIMNRFDKVDRDNAQILSGLFMKLKINTVYRRLEEGKEVMNIVAIHESSEGITIEVV